MVAAQDEVLQVWRFTQSASATGTPCFVQPKQKTACRFPAYTNLASSSLVTPCLDSR